MRPQTLMTVAVAGGCGVLALFGVKQATDHSQPVVEPEVQVLTAVTDIPIGVELGQHNVTFRNVKVSAAPKNAIRDEDQYKQRTLKIPAIAGEVILAGKLGEVGEAGKSMIIPKGYRVEYMKVDEEESASSQLKPGDRVDVVMTYQVSENVGGRPIRRTKAKTLLEYVEVFGVNNLTFGGGGSEDDQGKVSRVGLLMKPETVNLFLLAKERGRLHLTWRNRSDDADIEETVIDDSILEELNGQTPDTTTANAELAAMQGEQVESDLDAEEVDFEDFLQQTAEQPESIESLFAAQPQIPQMQMMPVAEPARRWTMKIYNGGAAEEIEVDFQSSSTTDQPPAGTLPVEAGSIGTSTSAGPAMPKAVQGVAANGEDNVGKAGQSGSPDWLSGLTEKFLPSR